MTPLWHYTCRCSLRGIDTAGRLLPTRRHTPGAVGRIKPAYRWMLDLIWLTDLAEPDGPALGLTRRTIACDRTEHRYRVTGGRCLRWAAYARGRVDRGQRERLEAEPGGVPAHWWVATGPVPVVYDPLAPASARITAAS